MPTVPDSGGWDGHALYIPDLGIGRLIETPGEIIAQIDAFTPVSQPTEVIFGLLADRSEDHF